MTKKLAAVWISGMLISCAVQGKEFQVYGPVAWRMLALAPEWQNNGDMENFAGDG